MLRLVLLTFELDDSRAASNPPPPCTPGHPTSAAHFSFMVYISFVRWGCLACLPTVQHDCGRSNIDNEEMNSRNIFSCHSLSSCALAASGLPPVLGAGQWRQRILHYADSVCSFAPIRERQRGTSEAKIESIKQRGKINFPSFVDLIGHAGGQTRERHNTPRQPAIQSASVLHIEMEFYFLPAAFRQEAFGSLRKQFENDYLNCCYLGLIKLFR